MPHTWQCWFVPWPYEPSAGPEWSAVNLRPPLRPLSHCLMRSYAACEAAVHRHVIVFEVHWVWWLPSWATANPPRLHFHRYPTTQVLAIFVRPPLAWLLSASDVVPSFSAPQGPVVGSVSHQHQTRGPCSWLLSRAFHLQVAQKPPTAWASCEAFFVIHLRCPAHLNLQPILWIVFRPRPVLCHPLLGPSLP